MRKDIHILMLRSFIAAVFILGAATGVAQDSDDDVYDLSPFEVGGSALDEVYRPSQSNTGTIIAKDRNLIPFGTSVLTDDLLDDMVLDNPSDFTHVLAGVSKGDADQVARDGGTGGNALNYRIRGFTVMPLYNGFQTGGSNHSPDGIGRVDVVKTPNSILYGQSSAGGTINFIPKTPLARKHGTAAAGIWSNNGHRAYFDVGGPIGEDDNMGIRLGGGTMKFDREQEFFESWQSSVYGAYKQSITETISLEVTGEYIDFWYNPSRTAAFPSVGSEEDRVSDPYNRLRNDRNFSYHGPHVHSARETILSTAYLTYRPSESFSVRAGAFYGDQEYDFMLLSNTYGLGTNESANGRYDAGSGRDKSIGYKLDILHQGMFQGWSVDTLLGYEYHEDNSDAMVLRTDPSITPINITIPFSRRLQASDFPRPPSRGLFTDQGPDTQGTLDWDNIRLTQFFTSSEERTTIMWGIAKGDGENEIINNLTGESSTSEGDDVTYSLGATHSFDLGENGNKLVLFANYSTSFLIQGGNQQNPADFQGFATAAELETFVDSLSPNAVEPQTGSGFEAGLRFEIPDKKLRLTVAYFDQSRENIARGFFVRKSQAADSDDEQAIAQFQLASGEERSKGFELSVDWNPNEKLSFMAAAVFMDGEVVSNDEVPGEVGLDLIRSPETQINFWSLYRFGDDPTRGFSVGLGASYNDETRVFPAFHDRFRLSDDYTEMRLLLRYKYAMGDYNHSISLNIDNLLDQDYVTESSGQLSEPIIYKLTYRVDW